MDLLNDTRNIITIVHTLAIMGIAAVVWLRKPGQDAQDKVAEAQKTIGGMGGEIKALATDVKAMQGVKAEVADLNKKVASLNGDVALVQQEIKHLPTRHEVAELARALGELEGQNQAQTKILDIMHRSLTRIEDHMIGFKK